jgi:hypothetical protein
VVGSCDYNNGTLGSTKYAGVSLDLLSDKFSGRILLLFVYMHAVSCSLVTLLLHVHLQ